jgi:hypothetical protein
VMGEGQDDVLTEQLGQFADQGRFAGPFAKAGGPAMGCPQAPRGMAAGRMARCRRAGITDLGFEFNRGHGALQVVECDAEHGFAAMRGDARVQYEVTVRVKLVELLWGETHWAWRWKDSKLSRKSVPSGL